MGSITAQIESSGMFGTLPLADMAKAPDGAVPRAGVFGLVKASGKQRLIVDRRPWNFWEHDLPGLKLPRACCFTRLVLDPAVVIRLHLRDASNYYYKLRAPPERLPYQGVGPCVSAAWWAAGCPADWPEAAIFPEEDPSSPEVVQPVSY